MNYLKAVSSLHLANLALHLANLKFCFHTNDCPLKDTCEGILQRASKMYF